MFQMCLGLYIYLFFKINCVEDFFGVMLGFVKARLDNILFLQVCCVSSSCMIKLD